jgi:hypothetical protein
LVDQQYVENNDLGSLSGNGLNDTSERRTGKRIAAFTRDHIVVYCDDRDRIRSLPASSDKRADVGHRRFDALEEPEIAASVSEAQRGAPKTSQSECDQRLERAAFQALHY